MSKRLNLSFGSPAVMTGVAPVLDPQLCATAFRRFCLYREFDFNAIFMVIIQISTFFYNFFLLPAIVSYNAAFRGYNAVLAG